MQEELRRQRETTEQLIFGHDVNLNTIFTVVQFIGQRNGLAAAEAWFEGRLIEVNEQLAALNKSSNVPITEQ